MKLDQLQYFIVTAQTQHIGKAAKILNVSPSAISHSIRNLEEDLGQMLFERAGKNIHLTEVGKRFSGRAKNLIDQAERLRLEFQSEDVPLEGNIRIGATHGVSNLILAPILGKFQKLHSGIRYESYSLRSAQVLEMTALGQLDVGVCFSPQNHPAVVVHHKRDYSLMIAVNRRHPILQSVKRTRAALLSELPCASPKAFSGIEVCEDLPALRRSGVRSNPALIFDSYEIAAEYLKTTNAWALMPDFLIPILGLEPLEIENFDWQAYVAIIGPKGRAIPLQFLELIADAF